MKFAVFAALVASSSALTGCKKGITGKVYKDSKCAEEANSSFNLMEKHVKDTGKCNSSYATEDDKKALVTAQADLVKATAATKVAADALEALPKITVDDTTVTDTTKVRAKEVTA